MVRGLGVRVGTLTVWGLGWETTKEEKKSTWW